MGSYADPHKTPLLNLNFIYWASIGGSHLKPKNADTLRVSQE